MLDTVTGFKDDKVYNRSYELDVFPGPKACRKADTPSKRAWLWLRIRHRKRIPLLAKILNVTDEVLHGADLNNLPSVKGETLLIGFWQEESYFLSVRDQLRKELCMEEVQSREAHEVAVHVRRVQYTRGVGEGYFQKALARMRAEIPGVKFSLFTDDPEWGRRFADSQGDMVCESKKGDHALNDFQSLRCFHHWILANSTFSWWAAWLEEQERSRIICPGSDEWSNPATPPARWITPEEFPL
ncbi:MAG: alpha-1,2-fucosyltransferase [Kiritimatiellia bacterium]